MPAPRRIAILGGGMASLSAALELTAEPDWQARYQITVYQVGWRLGGKGASSRNAASNGRIEEHGLHVWFGCYDQAFRILRTCYDELARPPGSTFATLEDAFHPQDETPYFDPTDGGWTVWPLWFPPAPDRPGTGGPNPSAWDDIVKAIEAVAHALEGLLHPAAPDASDEPAETSRPGPLRWLPRHLAHPTTVPPHVLLGGAARLARRLPRDPAAHPPVGVSTLLWLVERGKTALLGHLEKAAAGRPAVRRALIELDLALTAVAGCIRDGVLTRGFGAIDGEDARAWFARNGASPEAVSSTPVRALYDLYLAYLDGDRARPVLEAGVAVHAVMRLGLGYKGAVVNEMRGGMGEVVIAPIYQVLAKRGVEFAFFHRVERLELSPDRSRIARIHVARQVDLADGTTTGYRPLQVVGDLPCWPAIPHQEQIRDGGALDGVDLESRWSGWTDVGQRVLEDGRDFDVAVLGISLGALPEIAADLMADDRWRDMVDHLATTQSLSAQLWFDAALADLGWDLDAVPADAAPEPLDVWADRTELLPLEAWPAPPPLSLQYLCGAMPGDFSSRPPSDTGVPAEALAQVNEMTAKWLERGSVAMFPKARSKDGGFAWSLLHDPANGAGEARRAAQYLRANIDPSERYVLSPPGSSRFRLAADGSGYDNLILAGDWTATAWNVGCIEAAVESGVNAATAIDGLLKGAG